MSREIRPLPAARIHKENDRILRLLLRVAIGILNIFCRYAL